MGGWPMLPLIALGYMSRLTAASIRELRQRRPLHHRLGGGLSRISTRGDSIAKGAWREALSVTERPAARAGCATTHSARKRN